MLFSRSNFVHAGVAALYLSLAACGGGGSNSASPTNISPQDETSQEGVLLTYQDIEPILQARCIGCHNSNSGENPLAPFSLEGEAVANSFKPAINFAMESQTMPPPGFPQATNSEREQLLAWSSGEPYIATRELRRIKLAEALAWGVQQRNQDAFLDHRPDSVDCDRDTGWMVEGDLLEIRTQFCNYASLSQQSLLDLAVGTELEFSFSHSALNFNAPSEAHVAISIEGQLLWEDTIPIPSPNALIIETLTLPFAVVRGDSIEIHIHNHGDNAWTVHGLDAMIWSDVELDYCPTFESTFEAIQATVFERTGCANSLCHGEAQEGGLDLRPSVAWENLVGVPSEGSSYLRIDPRDPDTSYFFHKLSAKTIPGSYEIDGAEMPSGSPAISNGQLEAIRLWIEAGAPKEGSVGDSLSRGEDEIERLLGVCLPEAEAVNTLPLPPPEPDKGIQLKMPPHAVPAESEREICFAVYEDFRDVIPEEYLTEDGERFYLKSGDTREDAYTHHNLIYRPALGIDQIHHPDFGEWMCVEGDRAGEICEPTDKSSCGAEGQCRSEIQNSVACRGYGPPAEGGGAVLGLGSGPDREGFFSEYPAHGIFYWNSHAFNTTTEDATHHVWRNLFFADDRRFRALGINDLSSITAGTGTPPFGKKTECRNYVFNQGDGLLSLSSHTHKRGERFFMNVGDELIYETFTYDEPLNKVFDPAMVFNSADPAERVLEYCATWNNGVNPDGSPNVETVTRASLRPSHAIPCNPTACVSGNVGAACNGAGDDATCDSSPGAGDGSCDACIIMPGVTTDDEMFILLGSKMANHDALINAPGPDEP
jgi:predicted CxxxxCH...CXXCH cytochrome family protein